MTTLIFMLSQNCGKLMIFDKKKQKIPLLLKPEVRFV